MYFRSFKNCYKVKRVVIGTTGFTKKEEDLIKNIQKNTNFKSWKHECWYKFIDVYNRNCIQIIR